MFGIFLKKIVTILLLKLLCDRLVNYTINCSTGSIRHHLVQQHNLCDSNYRKHKMYQSKKSDTQKESEEGDDCISNNEETTMPNSSKKLDNYISDSLLDFILCTDQSFSILENEQFIKLVRALNKKVKLTHETL